MFIQIVRILRSIHFNDILVALLCSTFEELLIVRVAMVMRYGSSENAMSANSRQ